MNPHEPYEILCAMITSGEASPADVKQLRPHLQECPECRQCLSAFTQVSALALPLHGERHMPAVPSGMTSRFVERARAEGIPLLSRSPRFLWLQGIMPQLVLVAAVALCLLVGVTVLREIHQTYTAQSEPAPAVSQISTHPTDRSQLTVALNKNKDDKDDEQVAQLRAQLASSQQEIVTLEEKLVALQLGSKAKDFEKTNILSTLSTVVRDNTALRLQLINKDFQQAEMKSQFEQKGLSLARESTRLAERQAELDGLNAELSGREAELGRERQVLAASAQARGLITARNLHIIDVHDNDRSGRERPFGRVFYTEGQSLIFYAYDLDASSQHNTRVAFNVWGSKLGDQRPAKNLGVFRIQDSADGRWVLTCDDPHVLAQINTVFVTVESARNKLDGPKGKRILYAFLGDHANHP